MVAMHYISDREDTEMWREQKNMARPESLNRLIALWQERLPEAFDIPTFGYELFQNAHFWHVAQGQGLLNKDLATIQLDAFAVRREAARHVSQLKRTALESTIVKHHEIF